ncbi:MAG: FkbM family methyltransferase [Thermoflexibacter sp.]|jgi:FkbM family methyltransferase|nr:FkbM family methyltransferase [Thermoflexibacter sp.]
MLKKLQALSRWADYFFTIWKEYGLANCLSFFKRLFTKKNIILNLPTGKLIYNHESTGATVYHLINSLPKLQKTITSLPKEDYKIMIDVGANCGHFSRFFADRFPQTRIFAVEPSPDLFPVIEENLKNKHFTLIPYALADRNGEMEFYLSKNSQQANSLIKDNVAIFDKEVNILKVRTQTFQTFLSENHIDAIGVLKMDCQGAEYMILKNAEEVLLKTKYLILEVSLLDDNMEDLLLLVRKHFPHRKVINSVSMGADVLFWK